MTLPRHQDSLYWEFLGDPEVEPRVFTAVGWGSIAGQESKISQDLLHGQKKKKTINRSPTESSLRKVAIRH